MDKPAQDLNDAIEAVRAKLHAENIDLLNYDACIACLSKCALPKHVIRIYETYINY